MGFINTSTKFATAAISSKANGTEEHMSVCLLPKMNNYGSIHTLRVDMGKVPSSKKEFNILSNIYKKIKTI